MDSSMVGNMQASQYFIFIFNLSFRFQFNANNSTLELSKLQVDYRQLYSEFQNVYRIFSEIEEAFSSFVESLQKAKCSLYPLSISDIKRQKLLQLTSEFSPEAQNEST